MGLARARLHSSISEERLGSSLALMLVGATADGLWCGRATSDRKATVGGVPWIHERYRDNVDFRRSNGLRAHPRAAFARGQRDAQRRAVRAAEAAGQRTAARRVLRGVGPPMHLPFVQNRANRTIKDH